MTLPFEVGEPFRLNLRRLRRRAGLSQEQLAARASLHRTAIGLMENGRRLPRIDTLMRLAASLEVTPNELLDGIEWVPPREQAEGTFWMRGRSTVKPVPRSQRFEAPKSAQ
jgi:transcriptional regulator with XRE-family HTH domain